MSFRHIVWDWNGTLLDDLELTVEVCDSQLKHLGLPGVKEEVYRRTFCHPVRDFYRAVGVDYSVHSFQELTDAYHALYARRSNECSLFGDISQVLEELIERGVSHSILSALPDEILVQNVLQLGIRHLFTSVRGLDNNHAESKVQNGRDWLSSQSLPSVDILLVGDTDHDAEVASELGIACVLIDRGHQHREVIECLSVPVVSSATELLAWLDADGK
jgi:phosphoglycolate phosphatase